MTAKIILNPYAGRWTALKRKGEVEEALRKAGIDFEMVVTEGPAHAIRLAQEAAAAGYSPIIAAGGDGTVSEVANGLLANDEQETPPFGIMPLGSADDLVCNLGSPRNLDEAAEIIAAGSIQPIDVCKVSWKSPDAAGQRYFVNNSAIGLEPYITLKQMRMQRLKGSLRYMTATVLGVLDKPKWNIELSWEGGAYSGPVTLVTVGNGPRTGGVFYVTPHADLRDGLLTFVHGYLPTRMETLRVLPRTTKPGPGNYVEHPAVHEINSPWLKAQVQPGTPLHADGEIQTVQAVQVEYSILPQRLPIISR
jgi:diacylglycerol kinase (ATP)